MRKRLDVPSPRSSSDLADDLRLNLEAAMREVPRRVVIVTSALPREGRTSAVVTVANSMAKANRRIVAVDLHLGHPSLHERFGGHNDFGVTDVLTGRSPLQRCLQFIKTDSSLNGQSPGFYLVAAGPPLPSSEGHLVERGRSGEMLRQLAAEADLVVVDVPPALSEQGRLAFESLTGAALLVVLEGCASLLQINETQTRLARNHIPVLGVVFAAR